MATEGQEDYTLREISHDDTVSGLSLGDVEFAPLKSFLSRHAKRYHKNNAAKTYVAVPNVTNNRIVGYITLVCSQIHIDPIPADVGEYNYEDFPAVKIARLAVDRRHRGKYLGIQLVQLAMAIVTERIMPHVGCRFIVLDAKQQSIKFYEARGFRLLDTEHNRQQKYPVMFIDIGKLD